MAEVRLALASDKGQLLVLMARMWAESALTRYEYDPEAVARVVEDAYGEDHCLLVAAKGPLLIGFLMAYTGRHWFSSNVYAADMAFYVVPERRGSPTAGRLLKAFEHWCAIREIPEIIMGVSTGIHPERTGRFFQKMGYAEEGRSYRRIVHCTTG